MFDYKITAQNKGLRTGELKTSHGVIKTPVFMPVGTHGAVKGVSPDELKQIGTQIILGNTYHLYLRPGDELINEAGDLHNFMRWDGPILTDSGGFQVFSLGERGMAGNTKKALRTVSENGIEFKSHLDGSNHLFTPEKSMQIQHNLGADIIMAFDQPVYGMSGEDDSREAMERSMRWLNRSLDEHKKSGSTAKQALFGIVQGGIYEKLHRESAEHVASLDLPGNAIGGLSVGEGKVEMWQAVESINSILPDNKPRYFMGLGDPIDVIEASIRGVDMYDCVAPSRLARHGVIWQVVGEEDDVKAFWEGNTDVLAKRASKLKKSVFGPSNSGKSWEQLIGDNSLLRFERLNLHNAKFKKMFNVEVGGFPISTLSHYVTEGEMLGYRILTMWNIQVLHQITEHLRNWK